jgi:DNA processing protein
LIPTGPAGGGELRFWLALHRAPLVGTRRFAALLERFGTPRAVLESRRPEWLAAGLPEPAAVYLEAPDWAAVERDLAWLEAADHHHCLLLGHSGYPPLLAEIADPPVLLFVAGRPDSLALRHIAIVGSRNPSPAGCQSAREFAESLVASGLGIVSGLALGIDAAGHRGALRGGGITVAVAGAGPDRIYPRQHQALAAEIIAGGGALVSEFPPGTEPKAGHFPRRNRIISGLSLGTLVVEAALRSGSLITARLAVEQNREVFAIPGSIYNPLAAGCNDLIKQGAKLVQSVDDILEELQFRPATRSPPSPAEPGPEAECPFPALLKCIAYDPTSVDTLVAVTGNSAEIIASQLLLLELQGFVASTPGGCYIRLK